MSKKITSKKRAATPKTVSRFATKAKIATGTALLGTILTVPYTVHAIGSGIVDAYRDGHAIASGQLSVRGLYNEIKEAVMPAKALPEV